MKKTNTFGKIMTREESVPDTEAYYTASVIETVLLVERQIADQWHRTENLQISPYRHSQPVFNKGAVAFNGGRVVFSTNSARAIGIHGRNYEPHNLHKK